MTAENETPQPEPAPSAEPPYVPPIETPEPVAEPAAFEPEPEPEPAPPVMVKVAILDSDGIYQGVAEITEGEVTADHVRLDEGCDLPPDAYRWDRERKTFVHCGPAAKRAEESPNTLNAVAWGFLAMWAAGIKLPAKTLRWLDWYGRTMDFQGTYESDEEIALLTRYADERGLK